MKVSNSNKALLLVVLAMSYVACSGGAKRYKSYPTIREENSVWVRCEKAMGIENPEGKLCNTHCKEGKLTKTGCKKEDIVIRVKDFKKDFGFFRGFACVPEHFVF